MTQINKDTFWLKSMWLFYLCNKVKEGRSKAVKTRQWWPWECALGTSILGEPDSPTATVAFLRIFSLHFPGACAFCTQAVSVHSQEPRESLFLGELEGLWQLLVVHWSKQLWPCLFSLPSREIHLFCIQLALQPTLTRFHFLCLLKTVPHIYSCPVTPFQGSWINSEESTLFGYLSAWWCHEGTGFHRCVALLSL